MFSGASSFNQPLNDWRVDNVTDMHGMFHNQPPSRSTMSRICTMFLGARRSTNRWTASTTSGYVRDVRPRDRESFNQPLNDWRVDKVTNMQAMFWAPRPSTRTSATGRSTRSRYGRNVLLGLVVQPPARRLAD